MIPGVNCINVLRAAFTWQIPRAQKDRLSLFAHLGSECAKAADKMLMKLTPGLNFINVLRTAFTLADPESVKRYL